MAGFYAASQIDIVRPYFDKFFDVLVQMHSTKTHKDFEAFFYGLLPRLEVTDTMIVKLVQLYQEVPDTDQMFKEILQDGIDLLIRTKTIRALASNELTARL